MIYWNSNTKTTWQVSHFFLLKIHSPLDDNALWGVRETTSTKSKKYNY